METFKIKDDHIQLNQLLKALAWVENGADANMVIDQGMVKVNGETELRKRNKIRAGFKVEFNGNSILLE
ncbi:MAG: RNA-binding protein [Bacteroidota bacterium]|jgi:ribosome-associated protein|nr:RNA-binding protein [Bacteroidota bacterium]